MKSLAGKTAIVSGGSDGIGRSIAETFAAQGAHVVICARNEEKLKSTCDAIAASGGACEYRVQDVSDAQAYAAMVEEVAADRGLDVLVNNAPHVGYGMISDTDLDGFQQNFRVNMDAPYMGTRADMAAMAEKGGSIINISSINGTRLTEHGPCPPCPAMARPKPL